VRKERSPISNSGASAGSVPQKYLGERVTVNGPLQGQMGLLAAAIHLDYYFRRRPDGRLIQVHRDRAHPALAMAERARDEQWHRKSLLDVLDVLREASCKVAEQLES
jgi:hypothetical protein